MVIFKIFKIETAQTTPSPIVSAASRLPATEFPCVTAVRSAAPAVVIGVPAAAPIALDTNLKLAPSPFDPAAAPEPAADRAAVRTAGGEQGPAFRARRGRRTAAGAGRRAATDAALRQRSRPCRARAGASRAALPVACRDAQRARPGRRRDPSRDRAGRWRGAR